MLSIALNTFREIVRNKFFGIIIFLSVILILLSLGLDTLALGEARRVMFDFGLSFIELSGFAVILFLGGGLIAREIEGKTIYLMLSKPIPRGQIIIGKFIGFMMVLLLVVFVEMLILMGILTTHGATFDMVFFMAIVGILCKLLSLLAVILLASTIVSPGLAIFLTIATYVIGHGGYVMLEYALRESSSAYALLAQGVLTIFPNLESLNLKNLVATSATIEMNTYLLAFCLSLLYTGIVLGIGAWTFGRKSFDTV